MFDWCLNVLGISLVKLAQPLCFNIACVSKLGVAGAAAAVVVLSEAEQLVSSLNSSLPLCHSFPFCQILDSSDSDEDFRDDSGQEPPLSSPCDPVVEKANMILGYINRGVGVGW